MDAETEAAIQQLTDRLEREARDVAERVRWLTRRYEHEWKDAAAWRTHWSAELDALIAEVNMLKATVDSMEQRMSSQPDESQETQSERLFRKINALIAVFAEILFEMLPPDRQPLKERFTKALGDLLTEVIGGAATMAAGTVVALDKRITKLEEKQVGDDGRAR